MVVGYELNLGQNLPYPLLKQKEEKLAPHKSLEGSRTLFAVPGVLCYLEEDHTSTSHPDGDLWML